MTASTLPSSLIHLVLVSDQTIPNLIPALMERPAKVYLVSTEAMERKGLPRRLKSVLKLRGVEAEILRGAPEVGLASILEYARAKVADRLAKNHPSATFVLNATGGTKLMVLGFTDVFRDRSARIVYTDTAHRRIECLPSAGQTASVSIPMESVLDVEVYLAAQGFSVERTRAADERWREMAHKRRPAAEFLASRISEPAVQWLIGALNDLADKALDGNRRLIAPKQCLPSEPRGAWSEILDGLQGFGLLTRRGRELDFTDEPSAGFLHGDWLEEYAWHVLREEPLLNVCLGVVGRWEDAAKAENEFDVLATYMNEMLFVECKTLRHGREKAKDADLLYKADSLGQDVRGLFGTTWLLTARLPEPEMTDRARQQGVRLFGPSEIAGLRDRVREWMESSSGGR